MHVPKCTCFFFVCVFFSQPSTPPCLLGVWARLGGEQLIQLATPNLEGYEYSITSQPLKNLLDVEQLLYVFVKCLVFQLVFFICFLLPTEKQDVFYLNM